MISEFRDDYAFLSNFYQCPVYYNGIIYRNAEAAFQAQKSLDINIRKQFRTLTGAEAKRYGRTIAIRPDWEEIKLSVMYNAVLSKFLMNKGLKTLLINTNSEELVEGNNWNDQYWGRVNGMGKNYLGRILMSVRSVLIYEEQMHKLYSNHTEAVI